MKRYDNSEITAAGSFLERELLQKLPQVYERRYAQLWAEDGQAITVTGSLDGYAEQIEAELMNSVGEAKEYSDGSTDIPIASSSITTENFNVHIFSMATQHSIFKLRAAQQAGRSIEMVDTNAAVRALRQKVNDVLIFGDTKRGSTGFMNDPNVPLTPSGGYDPNTATWQDHIDFFAGVMTDVADRNFLTDNISTIYIPNKLMSKLATTYQTGDSGKSAIEAIVDNFGQAMGGSFQGFRVVNETRALLLERFGVRPTGTNEDRIVFAPSSADVVDRLGDAPETMPTQFVDMHFRTVHFMRTSECMIHYPESMQYVDIPQVV